MSDPTLGNLIESLGKLKGEKKQLEIALELIDSRIGVIESEIMSLLDASRLVESASTSGKVAVSSHVYPKLEDFVQLEGHIFETRSLVLLEKRVAVTPYREMLTLGRVVPGVVPFTKRKLSYRPLNHDE